MNAQMEENHPLLQGVIYRLNVRHGWSQQLAISATVGLVEYLKLVVAERPTDLVPPYLIDEAWHEALIDTRRYAEFCMSRIGEIVHHEPPISLNRAGNPGGCLVGIMQR